MVKKTEKTEELITQAEFAEATGLKPQWVYQLVKTRKVETRSINKPTLRILKSEISKFKK